MAKHLANPTIKMNFHNIRTQQNSMCNSNPYNQLWIISSKK